MQRLSTLSLRIADALVAAAARGIEVRIGGDVDRREQDGFRRVEAAGLMLTYGDGAIHGRLYSVVTW